MPNIGIQNFRLPTKKPSGLNSWLLLSPNMLEELKFIASPKVVQMTLRAVDRAELYECRHPFWNSIANSYVKILKRFVTLQKTFPDITRVIHNDEVITGDILVSDFITGLNYGYMSGGLDPTKVCTLENEGGLLTGKVLRQGREDSCEIGSFKNEIWFFISHKFNVICNKNVVKSRKRK